jgi:hypothetical protein
MEWPRVLYSYDCCRYVACGTSTRSYTIGYINQVIHYWIHQPGHTLSDTSTRSYTIGYIMINLRRASFRLISSGVQFSCCIILVPTKRALGKHTHPWINRDLRHLSNQKQKAYTRARRSKTSKDQKRYKALKAELQRESRRAHSKYMEDVSVDLKENPIRFWSCEEQEARHIPNRDT